MPYSKMKANSFTSCARERNGLCVCPKSVTISKNSCSRVRFMREVDLDGCLQNNENFHPCKNIKSQEIEDGKDFENQNFLDDENVQFLKNLSPLSDPPTLRMESTENTCALTLLSPIFESIKIHIEADVNADAGLPFPDNLFYDDYMGMACLPDFKCDGTSMLFNMAEEYMTLPFLEDTFEATCNLDAKTLKNNNVDSDDSSLYFAIHQMQCYEQEFDVGTYAELDQLERFDPQVFIQSQPEFLDMGPNFQHAGIQRDMQRTKSVTLVLDLDETLVHTKLEHCEDANFSFPFVFNMTEIMVYVRQRPYLQIFLERVAEMFEVVVFTASQSVYAEQLLDKLDPVGKIISRRAYRESCICLNGNYIKDLTIFGVDLAKIAIIDNSPQVFQFQLNNGIPIESWYGDPADRALISLLPFLETLADSDDVRPLIAKRFGSKE